MGTSLLIPPFQEQAVEVPKKIKNKETKTKEPMWTIDWKMHGWDQGGTFSHGGNVHNGSYPLDFWALGFVVFLISIMLEKINKYAAVKHTFCTMV